MSSTVFLSFAFIAIFQAFTIRARIYGDTADQALYSRRLRHNEPEDECKDTNRMCSEWKTYSYCTRPIYREKMTRECRKTCGLCSRYCRDKEATKCAKWKEYGYCESLHKNIAALMKQFCQKTCGYCKPKAAISKCAKANGSTYGCCWDGTEKTDAAGSNCRVCKDVGRYALHVCREFRSGCDNGGITESWMTRYCPATCGLCGHEGMCIDREKKWCPKWDKNGYCDHPNLNVKYRMIKYCSKTCGICEESMLTRHK